jgi:hypothetical protein
MKRINAVLFALLLPALAAAHGGMREIKGTIVTIGRDSVVVKRVDGKNESVPLSASTTYRVGDAKGNRRDMRAGFRVVVHFGRDGKALEIHLPSK